MVVVNQAVAIEKVTQLFWENGYAGTTMRDIQKAIDMRPGSIYATFGGKDALYLKSLYCYKCMFHSNLRRVFSESDIAYQGLSNSLRFIILPSEILPPHICFLIKTIMELEPHSPELVNAAKQGLNETRAELAQQIQQVINTTDRSVSSSSEELAAVLQAQIIGLKTMLKIGRSVDQVEEDIILLMASLFKAA